DPGDHASRRSHRARHAWRRGARQESGIRRLRDEACRPARARGDRRKPAEAGAPSNEPSWLSDATPRLARGAAAFLTAHLRAAARATGATKANSKAAAARLLMLESFIRDMIVSWCQVGAQRSSRERYACYGDRVTGPDRRADPGMS